MDRTISFLQTIKPQAVEEFLDFYFYRRVAHLMVPTLYRLNFSPNAVTTLSMLVGLMAAYAVLNQEFVLSAVLMVGAIFFDCCDGQLARLTGKASPMGRIMDGFFDAIWMTSLWAGILFSGYLQSNGFPNLFWLMLVASISVFLHVWRFDGVKIKYLEMAIPEFCEKDMDAKEGWSLMKKEFKKFHFFTSLLALVIAFQTYVFVRGSEKKKTYQLTDDQKKQVREVLDPIINGWSWLGEGHHNTVIIIGLLLAPISPISLWGAFWIIFVPMNLWYIYCELRWKRGLKKIKDVI